jgi:dephospho-CoA kinase
VEVAWQGSTIPASLQALGAQCHVAGDIVRALVPEHHQDAVIDVLRREGLKIVSLTPVRTSLEEYFLRHLQPSVASAGVQS